MGSTQAQGFAEAVDDGLVSLRGALHYHLTANHYPPHPAFMIPVCEQAIELTNTGDWDAEVELPDNVEWRDGTRLPTAAEVVESFHLDSFVDYIE